VKVVVQWWWIGKIIVSPNRKDVITFHEGYKQWSSHSTCFPEVHKYKSIIQIQGCAMLLLVLSSCSITDSGGC
jgi:hypothetical protein